MPKQGEGAMLTRGATKLLESFDPQHHYSSEDFQQFGGLRGSMDTDVFTALSVGRDVAGYIQALERRNVDLLAPPRIKVSTFHAMKGGEDDNVAVYLGTTKTCAMSRFPDDEVRAFYVGITRAKEHLALVQSDKKQRFPI